MAFKDDLPEWKSYCDGTYYMKSIPSGFWDGFNGLVLRGAKENIKNIINKMAEVIPCTPTLNWGVDWLQSDLLEICRKIKEKAKANNISVLMDCIAILIDDGDLSCDEVNDFLDSNRIGYICYTDFLTHRPHWQLRDKQNIVSEMSDTQELIKNVSAQAYESFESAKRSLETSDDERSRKDAVRSCLDAVEAIIKEYGNDKDIKQASKNLRNSKKWGLDDIVKDGDAMFNNMHRLYPDLRHGTTEYSSMSKEEAEYWIARFSAFLRYMKKMADKNDIS